MPNRCVVCLSTRAYFDVTSGNNLDREKVYEDKMFEQQVILHLFAGESKGYEYVKSPNMIYRHFKIQQAFNIITCNRYDRHCPAICPVHVDGLNVEILRRGAVYQK